MTDPRTPATGREGPDCSRERLSGPPLARRGGDDRVAFLLQWMIGAAHADSGVVLLRDGDDHTLAVRAAVGLDASTSGDVPRPDRVDGHHASGEDAAPWLHRRHDNRECEHAILDARAAVVLRLPLESQRGHLGVVQVGFRDDHEPNLDEVERLQVIADHIAVVVEAARRAAEVEARNAELERANAALVELDRLKGDFLSMISHELRTPLTAIIGYTDLLLRGSHGGLNERQARHQVAVKKAAHRLLALVNDLLDVNRLESGRVELARESVAIYDAASRAIHDVEATARQRNVELRLDAPTTSPWVDADPERLHQIMLNLLDNALKFTHEGGRVTLHIDRVGDQAAVVVEDTGVGIPVAELNRIWDRFHQVDSSTRRHVGGTGLGLVIVRNLVALHGGRVAVQSDGPGLGSRFSFTLPLASVPTLPVSEPDVPPAVVERSGARRVVLIVDDEPDNREVIATLVSDDLGYETRSATNGEEALIAARSRPDLILLDLRMPGLSGYEVARQLKADAATASIPIVAITALADEDDQRAAREAGCVGCLTKPFTPASLATAVEDALGAPSGAGR